MKRTNAVKQAYLRYSRAYEQWHRECQHTPIKVLYPQILYLPGHGYEINGDIRRETAEQIISSLNATTREYIRLTQEHCTPIAPSIYDELEVHDPRLLDGQFESEVARESEVAI